MKILVIGANGNTGFRVVEQLRKAGRHEPVAMIRDESQRPRFENLGVKTVVADLEHPMDKAFEGMDGVIFAAGSGSKTGKDKTVLVDHLGGIRAAVTAATCGARRFIMLSSMNASTDSESRIKHYHRAKAHCDEFLMHMQEVMDEPLEWTIVCPGRLTDDETDGRIEVSQFLHGPGTTARDSLAATLVACLDEAGTVGKRFSVVDGKTEVEQALHSV